MSSTTAAEAAGTMAKPISAGDQFGDTTTLLDDWRSKSYVRRVSFDRAHDVFLSRLREELPALRARVTGPSED